MEGEIMAQVKGVPILGLIKFIKRDPQHILTKVLAGLPPETKKYLDEHIIQTAWYPYQLYTDLLRTLDKIAGNGDLSYCIEQGRLGAQHDLSTIYRIFLTFSGPKLWQTRAMSVWSSYFDTGQAVITVPSKNEALFTITDFPDIDLAHVKSVQGWNEQFLIICKYTNVKSEIRKCQCYGDPLTELAFTFESK
jgi:hypothetical protein